MQYGHIEVSLQQMFSRNISAVLHSYLSSVCNEGHNFYADDSRGLPGTGYQQTGQGRLVSRLNQRQYYLD